MDDNKQPIEKTNILFVSSECAPFCTRGGLSDFTFSLPKYINKSEKFDIRVVLPLYSAIPDEYKDSFELVGERTVELTWRKEYCGIYKYEHNDIIYYFIDNKQYFYREKIYGFGDDVERFSYFSKAVLDMLPIINFFPSIIHTNDWQTSMVCSFLKMIAWQNPKYEHIKTVLTIHNFSFQGKANFNVVRDLLGIEEKFAYLFDFFGSANILKASLLCADQVVTVSDTYKEEVSSNEYGCGLSYVLEQIDHKFSAITNGVDYEVYNPETDPNIFANYTSENAMENRLKNKLKLQEELGLTVDESAPIYSFVSIMEQGKGIELLSSAFEKRIEEGAQLIAMGYGNPEYINFFTRLTNEHPGKVYLYTGYDTVLLRKIMAGTDFFFSLKSMEPCGLFPLIANRYGCLPIVYLSGGIKDNFSNFNYNGGNGYILKDYNSEALNDLIERTLRHFKDKERLAGFIENSMKQDFDIQKCVEEYIELYEEM